MTPDRHRMGELIQAGLGKMKVVFPNKKASHFELKSFLEEKFPRLADGGGFEVMRTAGGGGGQRPLHLVPPGKEGYPLPYIKERFPQTTVYIRPLQADLDESPLGYENSDDISQPEVHCLYCGSFVTYSNFRSHKEECEYRAKKGEKNSEPEEVPVVKNHETEHLPQQSLVIDLSDDTLPSLGEMLNQPAPEVTEPQLLTGEEASGGPESKTEETSVDMSKEPIELVAKHCVNYCNANGIENPVEILRYAQSVIVTGRPLDVRDLTISLEGETNDILINREDVLRTAMDEMQFSKDPRLTLEVSFYNETAADYGGPRKEFFRLCLQEIKAKYFDHGLKVHLADDYSTVGLIMAMSTLQNGTVPRFLKEEDLQALFSLEVPSNPCISKLRDGFERLGLYQITTGIPNFLHLFRPSPAAALTRRKLISILRPIFSEEGSNTRHYETAIYDVFAKYTRLAASGQRGSVTLEHILHFVTCSDEEPPLGFGVAPCIQFVEKTAKDTKPSFVPTANTCACTLYLPRHSYDSVMPSEEQLFNLYDLAFANAFFGNV